MIVRFFATLRNITGAREINIKSPEDINDLLLYLSKRFGKAFDAEIRGNGERQTAPLIPGVIILVNGRHYLHLNDLETGLQDSDTVSIFPPVAGG